MEKARKFELETEHIGLHIIVQEGPTRWGVASIVLAEWTVNQRLVTRETGSKVGMHER